MIEVSRSAHARDRLSCFRYGVILVGAGMTLLGCASTVHDTPVNYRYQGPAAADLHASSQRLQIGKIVDARGLPPRMIFQGHSLNGNLASGGDQAELPVVDVVRDALVQGLQAAHAPLVSSDVTLVLSGALVSTTRDVLPKGFFTGEFDAKLSVVLTLTATAASGKAVWHESFRVSDSITTSSPIAPKNMLNRLLDKLVAKLLSDEDFLNQMQ
jgi:hypothetical protein